METPEAPSSEVPDRDSGGIDPDAMALVLAVVYFIALFLPWFESVSGWALRAGDDAGLLALAVVLVEVLRRGGDWTSRSADLLAFCLTAATGILGVTTFVTFRWGAGATVSFSTFKYGAWIGLAAAILLIVAAALQLSVVRRQAE